MEEIQRGNTSKSQRLDQTMAALAKVKTKLKGHQKRISGLAFSTNLDILVSSGVDAHLCVWSIDLYCRSQTVYPFVVAAHPLEPNQFALGLTDGSLLVIDRAQ
ncbi:topless-related protein [Trifolium repens]|nr:topless-related protein [Trifolium repens]